MRNVICIITLGCLLFSAGCTKTNVDPSNTIGKNFSQSENIPNESKSPEQEKETVLFVNGKEQSVCCYLRTYTDASYAALPVLAIMKGLGAQVIQHSGSLFEICYKDQSYYLDIEKRSLQQNNKAGSLIDLPPGCPHGCFEKIGNDFYVDHDSLRLFFDEIGVDIDISFKNCIIRIIDKTGS